MNSLLQWHPEEHNNSTIQQQNLSHLKRLQGNSEVDDGLLKIADSNYGQLMMGVWMGPITAEMDAIMTTMDLGGEWYRRDRYCQSQ
jgi:hypothetical protein